jgi:hypothetical protein
MHEPPSRWTAKSSAALWAPLARFIAAEERLGRWAEQRPARACIDEFIRFGVKQAWACLFGGLMVALILATDRSYPPAIDSGANLALRVLIQ